MLILNFITLEINVGLSIQQQLEEIVLTPSILHWKKTRKK